MACEAPCERGSVMRELNRLSLSAINMPRDVFRIQGIVSHTALRFSQEPGSARALPRIRPPWQSLPEPVGAYTAGWFTGVSILTVVQERQLLNPKIL